MLYMTNVNSTMSGSASMTSRPKQPITIIFSSSMSLLSGKKERSPSIGMRSFLLIGGACYHRSTLSFYH